uniref:RNase III domain-containing protein n=1 Tax=Panagrolaimus sp. ES5 TaxID=591445 RepID=A0AC34GQB6_9BILA
MKFGNGNRHYSFDYFAGSVILNCEELATLILKHYISPENRTEATYKGPNVPSSTIDSDFNEHHFQNIETKIGYKFQNRTLLLQAFTNGSHHYASKYGTYQRLEFLGDAVLEYLIVRDIYAKRPKATNIQIGRLRSKLASNANFATLAIKFGLNNFILCRSKIHGQKYCADIFESLAAAVYLDSNKNLETVWQIFSKLMK